MQQQGDNQLIKMVNNVRIVTLDDDDDDDDDDDTVIFKWKFVDPTIASYFCRTCTRRYIESS